MFTNCLVMSAFLRLNSCAKSVKIIFELCGKCKEQEFIFNRMELSWVYLKNYSELTAKES